jgi:type IV pilus assembly protein PilN
MTVPFLDLKKQYQGIKDEIADLNKQNKKLRKQLGKVADFEKKKKDLEKKLAVLKDLKAKKAGPVHLLDELNRALPDKVWLTQFSEKGGKVSLDGYGTNEETVASFMDRLEKSPYYRNIELSITEQATVGGIKMQKFTLKCRTEKPTPN